MATKEKDIRVYFCPNCKSTNIKYTFGIGNLFGLIPRQTCAGCGLQLGVFPILVTNKSALNSRRTKNKKSKKAVSVKKKPVLRKKK